MTIQDKTTDIADGLKQQRLFEWIMYTAEKTGSVIWKAIRRDVIAAVALNGMLSNKGWPLEISGSELLNADQHADIATMTADTLIAQLDEPNEPREDSTEAKTRLDKSEEGAGDG